MMSRVLVSIAALCVSVPALAQTRVATLKASDEIREAFLSPRGDRIGACVGPDRIAIWSLPDGKLLQDVKLPQRPVSMLFAGHDQIVVAVADGAIEVRAIATWATVRRMEAGERQPVLAASADGRFLASSGTEQIRLWDSSGKLLHTFGHEFGSMSVLAFSPDGNLLVSAGYDAEVHFWDVSTGQRKATLRDRLVSTFAMAFTGDGKNLVIGGADGAIEIINVAEASIARKFPAEKHALINVSLSPDGQSIGAAYMDVDGMSRPAPVAVWALASGQAVQRATSTDTLPFASAFTPDGRWQYVTAKGHELTVWVLAKSPQR
jgi:WD40 repeat protein